MGPHDEYCTCDDCKKHDDLVRRTPTTKVTTETVLMYDTVTGEFFTAGRILKWQSLLSE